MKRLLVLFTALVVSAVSVLAQTGMLDDLTLKRDQETHRISSFDRTGGNADRLEIEPGETATLAEIEGAGIIRHIWVTINHPDKYYRRMLVLRMYWDGEENPSVEAPIGNFFGQGWSEEYLMNSMPIAAAPGGGGRVELLFQHAVFEGSEDHRRKSIDTEMPRVLLLRRL